MVRLKDVVHVVVCCYHVSNKTKLNRNKNRMISDKVFSDSSDDSSSTLTEDKDEIEELFLRSCRVGDVHKIKNILDRAKSSDDAEHQCFNVDCKGKSKSNYGWTGLHLASYFGHKHVMEILIANGIDINSINDNGDTALHKSAFIGREVNKFLIILNFTTIKTRYNWVCVYAKNLLKFKIIFRTSLCYCCSIMPILT